MQERQTRSQPAAPADAYALRPGQIATPQRLEGTGPGGHGEGPDRLAHSSHLHARCTRVRASAGRGCSGSAAAALVMLLRGWGPAGTGELAVGPVQQVVASRFFSALLARSGRVWTFGAGFNGELGTSASWATSPHPIDRLQQVAHCCATTYSTDNIHLSRANLCMSQHWCLGVSWLVCYLPPTYLCCSTTHSTNDIQVSRASFCKSHHPQACPEVRDRRAPALSTPGCLHQGLADSTHSASGPTPEAECVADTAALHVRC